MAAMAAESSSRASRVAIGDRPAGDWLMMGGERAPAGRQLADEPVGLEGIGEPGLGPAMGDAAAHRLLVHTLAPFVEQGELAARLIEAAAQPDQLRGGRMGNMLGDGDDGHGSNPLKLITLILSKRIFAEKAKTTGSFRRWLHIGFAARRG